MRVYSIYIYLSIYIYIYVSVDIDIQQIFSIFQTCEGCRTGRRGQISSRALSSTHKEPWGWAGHSEMS